MKKEFSNGRSDQEKVRFSSVETYVKNVYLGKINQLSRILKMQQNMEINRGLGNTTW